MIGKTFSQKQYHSAHARFLEPLLTRFFQWELPRFGPLLSQRLAQEVVRILDAVCLPTSRLQPGQLLWNVVHQDTRADFKGRRLVPVTLTLISPEEITLLEKGTAPQKVFRQCLARLFREAHAQQGLLSVRDAALLFYRHPTEISHARQQYEAEHQCVLPHPGSLQDMGSTVSHKALAVRKVVAEGKDPAIVAQEIHHSQKAVDHYVSNYHRVKTLYDLKADLEFIHQATHLAKHVIRQYIAIINTDVTNESSNEKRMSNNLTAKWHKLWDGAARPCGPRPWNQGEAATPGNTLLFQTSHDKQPP